MLTFNSRFNKCNIGRRCISGKVTHIDLLKVNDFCIHILNGIVNEVGYFDKVLLYYYYLRSTFGLDTSIFPLSCEADVHSLVQHVSNKKVINAYIEHGLTNIDKVVEFPHYSFVDFLNEVENGNDSTESSDDAYSSEDEIKNDYVYFLKELEVENANVVYGEHAVNVKNPNVGDDGDTSRATYAMNNPTIKSSKLVVILGVSIMSKEELIRLVEKIKSGALDNVISGLTTADRDVAHALVLDLARGFNYVNSDSDTPSEELNMDTPGVDESPIVHSKLELQGMTSGCISSGLDLTYASSTITSQKPTKHELDLLFGVIYDDYIGGQPSDAPRTAPATPANQILQTPNPSTTTTDSAPT
ncbi:hypothetical protein Tco_0189576 [Tanacetum coccineum]